jgi:hypothetical protein
MHAREDGLGKGRAITAGSSSSLLEFRDVERVFAVVRVDGDRCLPAE